MYRNYWCGISSNWCEENPIRYKTDLFIKYISNFLVYTAHVANFGTTQKT